MRHYIDLVSLLYENASVEDYRMDRVELLCYKFSKALGGENPYNFKFLKNIEKLEQNYILFQPLEIGQPNIESITIWGSALYKNRGWDWYASLTATENFIDGINSLSEKDTKVKVEALVTACNQINAGGRATSALGLPALIDDLNLGHVDDSYDSFGSQRDLTLDSSKLTLLLNRHLSIFGNPTITMQWLYNHWPEMEHYLKQ